MRISTAISRALKALVPGLMLFSCFGCSMQEEMRRIEAVRKQKEANESARSTNLNGEQVFIRSCNTCHPSGKKGVGPRLEELSEHFPDDAKLIKYLRAGKGPMPPQPVTVVNDEEMKSLVVYLHGLEKELEEQTAEKKRK